MSGLWGLMIHTHLVPTLTCRALLVPRHPGVAEAPTPGPTAETTWKPRFEW